MKGLVATCLGAALGLLVQFSPGEAVEYGPWYSGFSTGVGSIEINIDLDQLGSSRSGAAAISFVQTGDGAVCPREVHPDFCDELQGRARRNDQKAFDVAVLGVLYEGNAEAFVAFGFKDEETVRLLAIKRANRGAGLAAVRFYHPVRGIDAQINAIPQQHFCELAQCSSDRLKELVNNEEKAIGFLGNPDFSSSFDRKKDARVQAHAKRNQGTSGTDDNGFGIYQSLGQFMTAVWRIEYENGAEMGELRIFGTGTKYWGGRGELDELERFRSRLEVKIDERARADEFVDFDVTYFANGPSEQASGELLIALPASPTQTIGGVLVQAGRKISIQLTRIGTYEGEAPGDASGSDDVASITEINFSLRNIPEGRALVIRELPDRSSSSLGDLPSSANNLRVNQCVPSIDQTQFEEATAEGKLELLGGVWCEIDPLDYGIPSGFILGRYLQPSAQ
ncbi:MAG: hypothetical protein ABJO09_14380 [Hyphomicrobiales bacterium]